MRITKSNNLHTYAKIFIIYGTENRGKTTLINNLVSYMLIHGGEVLYKDEEWYNDYPYNTDHCIVIKYNNKVYGFMSQGDYHELLRTQTKILNEFQDRKINILIATARTKGGTQEWWHRISKDYKLAYVSDKELRSEKGIKYYSELFNEFKEFMGIN